MEREISRRNDLFPFRMFGNAEQEMNRVVDVFLKNPRSRIDNNLVPFCEASERLGHYMINFDLPGIPKEEINIDLSEGKLRVYGERKNIHKESNFTERRYGIFEKSIDLPENVSTNDAEAILEDGVLTISLKKTQEPIVKKIEIGTRKTIAPWSRLLGDD